VGTETGGLWVADSSGGSRPLSDDWAYPNVTCIVQRREFPPYTFLCGTQGALYRNKPTLTDPIAQWEPLNLPPGVNVVNRIETLHGGVLVISTDAGIWWAEFGSGDKIDWQQALKRQRAFVGFTDVPIADAWYGLARTGNAEVTAGTQSGVVTDPIIHGEFIGTELVFTEGSIPLFGANSVSMADRLAMDRVSIASCEAHPLRVYAAAFHDPKPDTARFFRLFRSNNGGRTWRVVSPSVVDVDDPAVDSWIHGMDAGGLIKNLTVHPTIQDRFALCGLRALICDEGWSDTPRFSLIGTGSPHIHDDCHTLLFAPDSTWPDRIFIATDGGLFRAADWHDPSSLSSLHNRSLRTLQFYGPNGRGFIGSLGSTPAPRGLVAGGLQDNGNVWKPNNVYGIWQQSQGADGGFNVPIGPERYFHQIVDQKSDSKDGVVYVQSWSGTGDLSPEGAVPLFDDAGNQIAPSVDASFEPVRHPSGNDVPQAIGWKDSTLYGLYTDENAANPRWQTLCLAVEPIGAVASYDGSEVLFATSKNNIYRMNPGSNKQVTMDTSGVPAVVLADGTSKPRVVSRLLCTGTNKGFASFLDPAGGPALIARRNGDRWEKTATAPVDPLPVGGGNIWGLDADDNDQADAPVLMVSTESKVWASIDNGDSWNDVSQGLPRQPHCADLRFNIVKRQWHLGTWGRSLWRSGKLVQIGVSSLIQSEFLSDQDHRNFEALILIGEELFHYFKDNRDTNNRWKQGFRLSDKATAPACIIRSDWVRGAEYHNFEALVLEDNVLTHWSRDNNSEGFPWNPVTIIPVPVTGPASMVQGDYGPNEDHGNFEALIPTADGLWHWSGDNDSGKWRPVVRVTPIPGSVGCIALSDYRNDGDHRALEAMVFEPDGHGLGVLSHFFWDPSIWQWVRTRSLVDDALGPAPLIQSDYIKGKDHHNLETIAWRMRADVPVLQHWHRQDDIGSLDWVSGAILSSRPQGPASLISSDFWGDADHRNFEAIFAEIDNDVWHCFRTQDTMLWTTVGSGMTTVT